MKTLPKDRNAFETLVRAHSADLYRYAYWLTRDRFRAEDLVQETYARAWKALDALREASAAKKWLFSILHNEYARGFERKRVEDQAIDLEEAMVTVEAGLDARLSMREALGRLPEPYREPLLLQVLGGFSGAEIGAMLGIKEAAVMTRLSRGRKALRERLTEGALPWKKRAQ